MTLVRGLTPGVLPQSAGVTVEAVVAGEHTQEAVGAGEGMNSRLKLHRTHCPENAADVGVGGGEFPLLKKVFWET